MDLVEVVTAILGGIILNLIANELFAWTPFLSNLLLRLAVKRLTLDMRDRMFEEWSAHLDAIPPGLWRVVSAVDLLRASYQINVSMRPMTRNERQRHAIETAERTHGVASLSLQGIGARVQMTEQKRQEALVRLRRIMAFYGNRADPSEDVVEGMVEWMDGRRYGSRCTALIRWAYNIPPGEKVPELW